jgi:hypothetical protein
MYQIKINPEIGQKAAEILYYAFTTSGIHGHTEMPEDILPVGIKRGSLEHLFFITLTVAIDYQRDANALWESSRRTFIDNQTRYLYNPEALHKTAMEKIISDMQKYNLSKKPRRDANIWRSVGVSFYKKWNSDPRNFLADCGWNSLKILDRLKSDHYEYNFRSLPDYPNLRGPKIGPLWLRMLRDNVGIDNLKNLECVPIPVDIHIARASLAIGVVRGKATTQMSSIFDEIRKAWFESVKNLRIKNRQMIALDIDEPLWHLSKYGCTKRNRETGDCPLIKTCEARQFCIKGKINIKNNLIELET